MKISIVVAIYNRKDELFELLNSLTRQSDKDFEVIIVDDGSWVDLKPTVELFENIMEIHYFKKKNTGPGLSRNYGAYRAHGEWLVFLDSDVSVEEDYIEKVKTNIEKFPCDAFGGADKAHVGFNLLQKAISYSMTSVLTTGGIRGRKKTVSKFQPRSFNMGIKKSVFLEVGGFSDLRIGEDPDLSMTLWEKGFSTLFYDEIGVYHKRRTDIGSFSKQVYQFGVARPILMNRHPQFSKITFWFPSAFLVGYFIGFIHYFFEHNALILTLYGLYTLLILFHATWIYKNIAIGAYSVLTSYIQFFSYGFGFLESWIKINVFHKKPKEAFPKFFY